MSMDNDDDSCSNDFRIKPDEGTLIEQILSGDSSPVCELFERYNKQAKAVARRFLGWDESRIEDAVQEAMMKAYMNLHRLRDRTRFGNWYLKIVRNIALDSAKRQNIYANRPDCENGGQDFESWAAHMSSKDVPEQYFMSDIIDRIKEELNILDTCYQDPIRMRYIEELSYNEIADILNKPLGTIKSLIHRGKAILRERIDARVAVGA